MAEVIATELINVVFKKLTDEALKRYVRSKGIHSELKNLNNTLSEIQTLLNDASEKENGDKDVKKWLNDLQHLAYDIDDILDGLATDAMHRELKTSNVRNFIGTGLSLSNKLSVKLDSIVNKLQALEKKKEALGLTVKDVKPKNASRRYETSVLDESRIVGREGDKKKLLHKLLGDDEPCDQRFGVVPIVGMGGVGKTTLARLLYNETQVNDHFGLKAWVCVSDDFDPFSISKAIFQSVTGENKDFANLNLLQVALRDQLGGKRFLLVLDDVWSESFDDWENLVRPFLSCARGSKIIMTTRKGQLLKQIGFGHPDKLEILSHGDALSLLAYHALGVNNFDSHPTLKPQGEGIVKKCDRLPLAIIALGRLLMTNTDVERWEEVLNSEIWGLNNNNIVPALRLSYHDLPACLKQLFAYCSLFPKDFLFDRDDLVLLWMAEGFLNQSITNKSAERLGHEYFDMLLSRLFFQPAPNDESLYVMHDLMNDLAVFVAGDCFLRFDNMMEIEKEALDNYRHMSFIREKYVTYHKYETFKKAKSLRTFLAVSVGVLNSYWDQFYLSNKILVDLLPKLPLLRVLCLSCFQLTEVPEFIGGLKHLRYLNLSQTNIAELPENVCNLYNLQTLIVFSCHKLSKLPNDFVKLKNLRHLDIRDTPVLKKMPLGICELNNLQTLTKIIIGGDDGFAITDLKKLKNLQGKTSIEGLDRVKKETHARDMNFSENELTELELEWSTVFDGSRNEAIEKDVLSELKPHSDKLKKLGIKSYGGAEFPNWVGDLSFHQLVHVSIDGCRKCASIPSLGQLPSLKELYIRSMNEVKIVGSEFLGSATGVAFPSLEILHFENMDGWEVWSTNSGVVFPRLWELSISGCPNLVEVSVESLPSLGVLEIKECGDGVLRSIVRAAPSVTKLDINTISGLSDEAWKDVMMCLGAVEQLMITYCKEIRYLWESEAEVSKVLVKLRKLVVENCSKMVSLGEKEEEEESNLLLLTSLWIWRCESMKHCICGNSIESLRIWDCRSMAYVSFPAATIDKEGGEQNLKSLVIWGCEKLLIKELGGGEQNMSRKMAMLESLYIYKWNNLKSMNEYSIHLTTLIISACSSLESIPNRELVNLTSLKHLIIFNCPSMDVCFPGGHWPPNLCTLYIGQLKKPISEWGNQNFPPSLVELRLYASNYEECNISQLSELLPPSLTLLSISDFEKLERVSTGLQHLTSLQHLIIQYCPNIKDLPETLLPSLLSLEISGCPDLKVNTSARGSPYWSLISHIPKIFIDEELSSSVLMEGTQMLKHISNPSAESSEITEIVEETPTTRVVEDKIYVAVGKDLKKSQSTLNWALHESGSKHICIFHVHKPAETIPFMGMKFRINQLKADQVTAYHEKERENMLQLLDKYNQICQKSGVNAEVKYIEKDSIEKGIVEFILEHNVRNLVMGAAADRQFSKRMVEPKSRKAIYVRLQAAASCQIHFICKGNIIFTRLGSSLNEPNANAYSEESSLSSRSVREEQNAGLQPSNPTQDYYRVMSDKHHETGKTTSVPNSNSELTLSIGLQHPTYSSEVVKSDAVSEVKSKNYNHPSRMTLVYSNQDLTEFPVTFFENIPSLQVLDLSNTSIKCLPSSISKLTILEELLLRNCDLMMELPPEIGSLTNLKVFDSEGTQLICLPEQFGSLTKLECLTFSLYNFSDKYKRIICADLSNLTLLKELSICVDSYGEWWEDEVKPIIDTLSKFRNLESLKLYFPTTELLRRFMEKQKLEGVYIYQHLLNFSFIVGRLQQRLISRVPHDLEKMFVKLPKFLKYTNIEGGIEVIAKVLRHASALFLDRHWTISSLSTFGLKEMENLKFCILGECNEMIEIINGSHLEKSSRQPVLGSLEYLSVYYMKSLSCIWNGPIHSGCLTNLKTLRLHSCPELTTVFTKALLDNLTCLEYLIIEDCEKIKSLISLESYHATSATFLPNLKKISLLHLVELISIFDGVRIAPRLESLVVYNCPNLDKLFYVEVSDQIREIKGENEWWDALKWCGMEWADGQPGDLARAFIPFGTNDEIMDELDDAINVFPQLGEFKEKVYHTSTSSVMERGTNDDPIRMKFLYSNQDLTEFPVTFFENIPSLQVLDLSNTSIKCLPSSISKLTTLEELFLRNCDLMMELPPEIGSLKNIKVFDSEGTQLICLPEQFGSLTKLECLTFSLYNFSDKYKRIICADLSNLTLLKELSICVDSYGEWWEDEVKLIIDTLSKFQNLESLKLYFPTTELLHRFMEKQKLEGVYIYQHLLNFSFIVGRLQQRLISRVPHDLEKMFVKLPKFLKYTNVEGGIEVIAKVLRHASALFLDRHWTISSLSTFGFKEMENLKFCILGECNEMIEIINGSHLERSSLQPVLGSLEYLSVYYMKSLSCIWNGPIHSGCLTNLKTLKLHSCPELTTVFTKALLDNLTRLEYLIIEDCEKIKSLISLESYHATSASFLPNLKKISLLHLVDLISIFDGVGIAPRLESLVVYNCPNLDKLFYVEVSNRIREIKGENEWWDALKWCGTKFADGQPGYLARAFIPFGTNGEIMDELDDAINVFPQLGEFKEKVYNTSTSSVMERGTNVELYDPRAQVISEAEESNRDAFEESIRRRRAGNMPLRIDAE